MNFVDMQHTAIFGNDLSMQSGFITQLMEGKSIEYFPHLAGKKGALFSNVTLNQFIDEEMRHDRFDLTQSEHRSIRKFSSGEQKKLLLNYLIGQKPEFLLLDNPFDTLDREAQKNLRIKFEHLSHEMIIIQVLKRQTDLLPFVCRAIFTQNSEVIFSGTIQEYLERYPVEKNAQFSADIPSPLVKFKDIPETLICFKNVSVSYNGHAILKNINWEIKKGEFWELLGPNGSGKTTLLTMINGDNPKAFDCDLFLFGRKKGSGETVWEIKEKIGYFTPSMMEFFNGRHKVERMIISGLVDSIGLYQKPNGMQRELARKWIQLLGIGSLANHPFDSLSQVQQRMVLIARAIIKHPPVLILDEPSNGLDDRAADLLVTLVNKIAEESDTAILYVSHRTEPGLKPHFTFRLTPSSNGSSGEVTVNEL